MGCLRKMQVLLLMVLVSTMILIVPTYAQEVVRVYDTGVVTGFEPASYETNVNMSYKYALSELVKKFPSQLNVRLGGEAVYQENQNGTGILTGVSGYTTRLIDVSWVCREDYDEVLDVYHFIPDFGEYQAADGLELPMIIANLKNEFIIPPMQPIPDDLFPEISVPEKKEQTTGKATLPTYYNGFTKGVLPAVRDQGNYGICWIFSSLACVEADLIHDGAATTGIDLSELHLAYYTFHNFTDEKGLNTGDTVNTNDADYLQIAGNAYRAQYPLTNMLGPVNESEAPYSSAPTYSPGTTKGRNGSIQVTGAYFYDILNDRDAVKEAIMNHGAVSAVYTMNTSYYSSTNYSYYVPTKPQNTNHVIAIVGWDDNFSKNNFISGTPEGNGAWLVRNSWGVNGYDYRGYFWMSYYDQSLSSSAVAFDAQPTRYDHIYAYDNCPDYYGLYAEQGQVVTQTFYVDGGEEIKAIGFFTMDSNVSVDFTVSAGSSSTTQSFHADYQGYYLIPLSKTLTVQSRTKVTVSFNHTNAYSWGFYEDGPMDFGGVTFNYATGSEGMVVNGENTGRDGKIKLFTNNASVNPLSTLTISQNNVLGYSNGIQLKTAYDKNATGYKITVYDIANKKTITPTIDKPVKSGSNVTIKIHGTGLVNGNLYKLTVYKYNTTNGTTTKSNTVTVYGMPNTTISKLTATPFPKGVFLNSQFKTGTDGTMYYVYDAETNKYVTKMAQTESSSSVKITGLTNGKLYYSYARPYRIYNNQSLFGPKSLTVYYAPVASPSGVTVKFVDETTAVISVKENSTTRGIRVLYRELGGSLKNGCAEKGNQCSIGNLSQAKNYEFYVMHYNLINNVSHYGAGVAVQYTAPTVSTMTRPTDAKIAPSNPTWTFSITKSSDAVGISVLYRINKGDFQLCCEKAGSSCTKDLSADQQYTFYIMQYKTVNGKKVYSPGITVKNYYGTKSLNGLDLANEFFETNEVVDPDEINNVLEEYNSQEDLLELDAQEYLAQEAQDELIEDIVNIEDEFDSEEEEDLYDEIPAEFLTIAEDIDDYEPTEEDFIDVPMDNYNEDTASKGLESDSDNTSALYFYGVDDNSESDLYAPSFRTK